MKTGLCWSTLRNRNIKCVPAWLAPDLKVEVYQYEINCTQAAYDMVLHNVNHQDRTVDVYYQDDPHQEVHTVSYRYIAPISYRIRRAEYSLGSLVEVYYRVDNDSPWGWWTATITAANDTSYTVKYLDSTVDTVLRLNVRGAIFV